MGFFFWRCVELMKGERLWREFSCFRFQVKRIRKVISLMGMDWNFEKFLKRGVVSSFEGAISRSLRKMMCQMLSYVSRDQLKTTLGDISKCFTMIMEENLQAHLQIIQHCVEIIKDFIALQHPNKMVLQNENIGILLK